MTVRPADEDVEAVREIRYALELDHDLGQCGMLVEDCDTCRALVRLASLSARLDAADRMNDRLVTAISDVVDYDTGAWHGSQLKAARDAALAAARAGEATEEKETAT